MRVLFFFNDTATTEIYTLSLHDALPICKKGGEFGIAALVSVVDICTANNTIAIVMAGPIAKDIADKYDIDPRRSARDRKSTRLNSSHANISYAVFCLKKKQHVTAPLL